MSGGLLHYLGLFIGYTTVVIGLIYGAYWYFRKYGAGSLLPLGQKPTVQPLKLEVESMLTLEARKNLYVIRSGQERFLVATSMEGTQFLSRLEAVPVEAPQPATETEPPAPAGTLTPPPAEGFGARFAHSLRWLATSRINLGKGV